MGLDGDLSWVVLSLKTISPKIQVTRLCTDRRRSACKVDEELADLCLGLEYAAGEADWSHLFRVAKHLDNGT